MSSLSSSGGKPPRHQQRRNAKTGEVGKDSDPVERILLRDDAARNSHKHRPSYLTVTQVTSDPTSVGLWCRVQTGGLALKGQDWITNDDMQIAEPSLEFLRTTNPTQWVALRKTLSDFP